ncbi:hypothetical protein E4U58_003049 [Claviceps cyperi]|nr:hypothetical protein E4U58_003049 [Claviceps cyperi]
MCNELPQPAASFPPNSPEFPTASVRFGCGTKKSKGVDEDDVKADELNYEDSPKRRSRGRPRKDTKDETATEASHSLPTAIVSRRLGSILTIVVELKFVSPSGHIASQRKDTTITTLEKRVKELERANDDISRDFNDFFGILVSERVLEGAPQASKDCLLLPRRSLLPLIKRNLEQAMDTAVRLMRIARKWPMPVDLARSIPACLHYRRNALPHHLRRAQFIKGFLSWKPASYPETYGDPITAPAVADSSLTSTSASTSASYSAPLIDVPSHPVSYGMTTAATLHDADFSVYSSI